ncbi:MAG: arylsulfotransferase family protein, partial [Planctomycetota bacterium]
YSLLRTLGLGVGAQHRKQLVPDSPGIQNLQALPYVDGTFDPQSDLRGVLYHDAERTWGAYGFYSSRERDTAVLIDMEGRVVHEWHYPSKRWHTCQMLGNGDVLAVVMDKRLIRLDKDSNHLWSHRDRFHHGTWVAEDGRILALTWTPRRIPELHEHYDVLDDRIVILTPDGEKIEEISVLDLLRASPYAYLLPSVSDRRFEGSDGKLVELDMLHTNHVEMFDGSLADRSPLFAKGNFLISMRNINAIAILDGSTREFLWVWGPTNLTMQHQPTLLENGHVLIFNNGSRRSSVLEFDPVSDRVVWRYAPDEGFFSKTRGSVQRLPNGNTLVTESDRGYVFELTPGTEIVWRFANPDVTEAGKRMAIWRMTRFSREELTFLEGED